MKPSNNDNRPLNLVEFIKCIIGIGLVILANAIFITLLMAIFGH